MFEMGNSCNSKWSDIATPFFVPVCVLWCGYLHGKSAKVENYVTEELT